MHAARIMLVLVTAVLSVTACKSANTAGGSSDLPPIVATIDGDAITRKDLEGAAAGQLSRLQQQIYQIHKVTLDNLIGEKLVAKAAKAAGKSPEEFLKQEIDDKIVPVDEATLKRFYEQNKAQMGGQAFDAIKGRIAEYLTDAQRRQIEQQLANRLRTDTKIVTNLQPPRTKVAVGDAPAKGPANAPVTIIEFSDFQCPFCKRGRPVVDQVLETYKDKVRYVFRDFPLSFHKQAPKAHEAAHCAGDQGKYWEMHTLLFEKQPALEVAQLKEYAKQLNLDLSAFDACLDDGKYVKRVQSEVAAGAEAGVSGTPAFFVNGIPMSGALPFAEFKKVIDEELAN